MNPALLLVVLLAGTAMLLLGVLAAAFGWLPLVPAIVLAGIGAIVETIAAVAFARGRRQLFDAGDMGLQLARIDQTFVEEHVGQGE